MAKSFSIVLVALKRKKYIFLSSGVHLEISPEGATAEGSAKKVVQSVRETDKNRKLFLAHILKLLENQLESVP